jgi:hypothetical protein
MRRAWINADFIRAIKSPTDLRVLLAIAAHAHEDGTGARPKAETIQELAGLESTRSVRRCVTSLITGGFLVADDRKGGRRSTNYVIPFQREPGRAESAQGGPKTTAQHGPAESIPDDLRRSGLLGPRGSNEQLLEQRDSGGLPKPPRPPDSTLRMLSPLHQSGGAVDLQVESAAATRSQTGTSNVAIYSGDDEQIENDDTVLA